MSTPTEEIIVVSGTPRSGTSLMMQMLVRGGIPALTDGIRAADSDNPEGYYEWEDIKTIGKRPEILGEARGKAVKVISALLASLPRQHSYRILFMSRPVDEVVASQRTMLTNRGVAGAPISAEAMALALERHRQSVLREVAGWSNAELLVVDYPTLVREPASVVAAIAGFLRRDLSLEEMVAAVRPELHRNRTNRV